MSDPISFLLARIAEDKNLAQALKADRRWVAGGDPIVGRFWFDVDLGDAERRGRIGQDRQGAGETGG